MRKLYYTGGYVLVSDQVCKALLRYARALAVSNSSDVVTVPAISDERKLGSVHMLIGPASQLFSTPTDDLGTELEDGEVVNYMERKTRELQPHRPVWAKEMDDIAPVEAYDFL